MGKKHMLSMKKLETQFMKEVSLFEALKKCEQGIHKFKLNWNMLTCNRCGFYYRIPEDELKDYLRANQSYKFWDELLNKRDDEINNLAIRKLIPLLDEALEFLNPTCKEENLIKVALDLMESPLKQVLVDLDVASSRINKIKSSCKFGKHLLTYEDPKLPHQTVGENKQAELADLSQSKGIWCKNCELLILSMTPELWNHFREESKDKINSRKVVVKKELQRQFKKLGHYNWITLKEKEKFQALINSYDSSERDELLRYFTEIDAKDQPFFFIARDNDHKKEVIKQYGNEIKTVVSDLMQIISTQEEHDIQHHLEDNQRQHSTLGKKMTALENLAYLYRLINILLNMIGEDREDYVKDPHLFLQVEEIKKENWHQGVKALKEKMRKQIKELLLERDTILYPDSEEHYDF